MDVNPPKNPAKRRALFEKMNTDQRLQLVEDKGRYQDLVDRGAKALSKYDREIAHAGENDLAWVAAIALKYNHISSARGHIQLIQQQLALPSTVSSLATSP